MTYEAHELGLAFPDMPPEQYRRFVADIKANGLNHPIVLFEGKILDGRHRYKACLETGTSPQFRQFQEGAEDEYCHGDPVAYVQSENASRRQLSESQLAYSITHPNIVAYESRKARERTGFRSDLVADRPQGSEEPGRVVEKLAAKAGVGARTVTRALKVREEGIPEVNEAVAKGEVTLNMAEKIVKLNPSAQKRVMEAAPARRGDALQEAFNRSDAAQRRDRRKEERETVLPKDPSTPFVRKILSGLERLALVCAEDGARDGSAIAAKFIDEMDWENVPLTLQMLRATPIFDALEIIRRRSPAKAA